jgi:hypothetical protein
MTEREWLEAANPGPLLAFLEGELVGYVARLPPERSAVARRHLLGLASERKRRLLACAFARQVWPLLVDGRIRHAVVVAERFADGLADHGELAAARAEAFQAWDAVRVDPSGGDRAPAQAAQSAALAALWAVQSNLREAARYGAVAATEASLCPTPAEVRRGQAALVRDVMGNPFRPPDVDPTWLGPAVVAVARAINHEAGFDQLPVLADALLDAGCPPESEVVRHPRGSGPHVRGCWCLDLLVGSGEDTG